MMDYSAIAELESMSVQEARECIEEIKRHQTHIRMLLFVLEERKGWQALGYDSMRECMVGEFGRSQSQLYRELKAAKVEREISPLFLNHFLSLTHAIFVHTLSATLVFPSFPTSSPLENITVFRS